MKVSATKNLHLPLPLTLYAQLKKRSAQTKTPATRIARQAIEVWLKQQEKLALYSQLAQYATELGGTSFDLDVLLEKTSIESLLKTTGCKRT